MVLYVLIIDYNNSNLLRYLIDCKQCWCVILTLQWIRLVDNLKRPFADCWCTFVGGLRMFNIFKITD